MALNLDARCACTVRALADGSHRLLVFRSEFLTLRQDAAGQCTVQFPPPFLDVTFVEGSAPLTPEQERRLLEAVAHVNSVAQGSRPPAGGIY